MLLCATIIFYTLHLQTTVTRIIKIVLETKREKKNYMNIFFFFPTACEQHSTAMWVDIVYEETEIYTQNGELDSFVRFEQRKK